MSNSTTNLDLIATAQASKEVTANALFDAMSANALYGRRASTTSGLTWGYYGGSYAHAAGTVTQIASGTISLTANTTNYLYDADGTITAVTSAPSGWPGPLASGEIALYEIVCGASGVISYLDWRARLRGPAGATGATGPAGPAGPGTSALTTKGDLLGFDTAADRVPVGSNGQVLTADSTQALGVKWATPSSGGGVAGSNQQIQFNDGGSMGADADFIWDKTNNILYVGSTTTPGVISGGPTSFNAPALTIQTNSGSGNGANGGNIILQAGDSGVNGTAGSVVIQSGAGGGGIAGPGSITIQGKPNYGGNVTVQGGSANNGPGTLTLSGGSVPTVGTGGAATLTGGPGPGGGPVTVQGGDGSTNGSTGGNATLRGGDSTRSTVSGSYAPGTVTIRGGNSTGNANTAPGAMVSITGGAGNSSGSNGGDVTIQGGAGGGAGVRGNVNVGGAGAALSTLATGGFMTIPTCAGSPTGTPASVATGQVAIVFDTTNLKLWAYVSGAWKATPAFI